ncbi:SH3 domain-containing protein [Streptomyces phaeolivaceus]|uniref:SH3 domain-containing protein n=1 Tax=Streptomyces phaeolivaceus TaxID=2653200 RepID=A0A5P8KCP8_9ACTN|nr:SH3 domain-containing protein [Streptomyces phaeolivaceus]QFR00300.1 SH3 domain-containing protein [Streptomyces phaeolivaceus]
MSLRILLMRFGIAAAGGALLAFAATTPAAGVGQEDPRESKQIVKGEVVARSGLILRSAPTRGGAIIRVAHHGEIVRIYCRTEGQPVDGTRQWYLLVDGTWAWGSARHIEAFRTPRWCDA